MLKKVILCATVITFSLALLTACNGNNETPVEPIPGPGPEVIDVAEKTDTEKFKEEYEALNEEWESVYVEVPEDVEITYLDEKELISFLENGTGILYFGWQSCPWCRNALPALMEVAVDYGQSIHYFNPKVIRSSENETYQFLMEYLDEYLSSDENGTKKLYVPDVYFLKDGQVMGHHLDTVESQDDPYEPLTNEQFAELKQIYEENINKIVE